MARGIGRREIVRGAAAVGGFGVAGLFPGAGSFVDAAASDRRAGAVVGADPIARILPSGKAVELVEFCTPPSTRNSAPRALLNFLYHANDGSGRIFANDSRGKLWAIDQRTGATQLFLNLRQLRGSDFIYMGSPQLGLRSFAFHPNFARPGKTGYRKLYTVSTETAAGRPAGVRVFTGPFQAHHDNVVAEWLVDAATRSHVEPGSRREVLRIAQAGHDHCTDQLLFNAFAQPGTPDYGKLYIGVGDGGNSPNATDPYDQAQAPGSALGKILRIKPVKQKDGSAYGVPTGNPFIGRPGWLPEIWALGLRHPQNLSFDSGGSGAFLITDIGQGQVEEVNLCLRGANFGWPLREGTFVTDRLDDATLYALPADDAKNGFTYPVAQYDHDEGNTTRLTAITGGYVYRGTAIPELIGQYLLGDIVTGRIFHVSVADLKLGTQTPLQELALRQGGATVTLMALAGVDDRVDLRFGRDQAGEIYLLTKQDGKIRKLAATAPG
jgi:glucose/arabinose dehydrogenase